MAIDTTIRLEVENMAEIQTKVSEKTLKCLEEIAFWLRFQGKPKLKEVLEAELTTDPKLVVYEMTDGLRSRREVAKIAKTSHFNVQHWWKRWYQLGLLTESEKFKGRPKRVISLNEVGIRVPSSKVEGEARDIVEDRADVSNESEVNGEPEQESGV